MEEPLVLVSEGNVGELAKHRPQQQTLLYPPSYFKPATDPSTQVEPVNEGTTAAATSPASTYVVSPRSYSNCTSTSRPHLQAMHQAPSASPYHQCLNPTPGVLTDNLLQVECELQSRLSHAEAERRRVAGQLEALGNTLKKERDGHYRDKEALICEHQAALEQIMNERREVEERWKRESDEWRESVRRGEEREREKEEELSRMQEELVNLAQEKTDLMSELEKERSDHRDQVASLHTHLSAAEDQIKSLEGVLQEMKCHVGQLESYLGGELPEEGSGVTWRDERSALLAKINGGEEEQRRLESETQLMSIRLSAISEILSLQEAKLTQVKEGPVKPSGGAVEVIGEVSRDEGLKAVLSLWREKVFALLVQSQLKQMQHSRETQDTQCRVACLQTELSEVTRDRDMLSHTLTDKTAQLQLQNTQIEDLERHLQQAEQAHQATQTETNQLNSLLQHITTCVRRGVSESAGLKSCVDGCMSRLANYEQRVGIVTRRVASLRAMLSSKLALQGVSSEECPQRSHTSTQTEVPQKSQEISKLSHELLVEEVVCVMRERETLADQLCQSTAAFQQLNSNASVRQQELEQTCATLEADKRSLINDLEEMRAELNRHKEMENDLRSTQASLHARIDSAVMEERKKCRHELSEAQSLLEVARREQSKTALQLQQAERKLHHERDCAVEAVQVSMRGVEEELQRCQDRLRAVQVERNLLLTTLRQEGIKVPVKRPQPRQVTAQCGLTQTSHQEFSAPATMMTSFETNNSAIVNCPTAEDGSLSAQSTSSEENVHSPSPPALQDSDNEERQYEVTHCKHLCGNEQMQIASASQLPHPRQTTVNGENNEEDIHNVLKELQLLSTSLLEMKAHHN